MRCTPDLPRFSVSWSVGLVPSQDLDLWTTSCPQECLSVSLKSRPMSLCPMAWGRKRLFEGGMWDLSCPP